MSGTALTTNMMVPQFANIGTFRQISGSCDDNNDFLGTRGDTLSYQNCWMGCLGNNSFGIRENSKICNNFFLSPHLKLRTIAMIVAKIKMMVRMRMIKMKMILMTLPLTCSNQKQTQLHSRLDPRCSRRCTAQLFSFFLLSISLFASLFGTLAFSVTFF